MNHAISLRDAVLGEQAGAFAPRLNLYREVGPKRHLILSVGSTGGTHQITLTKTQAAELTAALWGSPA